MTTPTKVCPREPTANMYVAVRRLNVNFMIAGDVWQAMYDAAPAEAAQGDALKAFGEWKMPLTADAYTAFRAGYAAALAPKAAQDKCDGNHGGPPCADPECWLK
jgi:hypothetical protein